LQLTVKTRYVEPFLESIMLKLYCFKHHTKAKDCYRKIQNP